MYHHVNSDRCSNDLAIFEEHLKYIKYNLKTLLAIPSKYILDDTDEEAENRMNFEHNDLFENYQKATFCTYKELKQMQESGLVVFGSHSHSHIDLTQKQVDLDFELRVSKEILEGKLNTKIDSFVFPFRKYNT